MKLLCVLACKTHTGCGVATATAVTAFALAPVPPPPAALSSTAVAQPATAIALSAAAVALAATTHAGQRSSISRTEVSKFSHLEMLLRCPACVVAARATAAAERAMAARLRCELKQVLEISKFTTQTVPLVRGRTWRGASSGEIIPAVVEGRLRFLETRSSSHLGSRLMHSRCLAALSL